MILLQCSRCSHQIEVGDSLRAMQVRCARCGSPLAIKTTGVQELVDERPAEAARTSHGGDQETLAVHDQVLALPFLSPPRGPGELGRLDHYKIVRLIGQGGMGIVFEAIDTLLERTVALKIMMPGVNPDPAGRDRFLREARAMAAVKSDHIVTVHQVGHANNLPYLAMEFLHGMSLEEWLKHRPRPAVPDAIRIAIQIARGLAAAHHSGLIHRDIKPGNVFLETPLAPPSPSGARPRDEGEWEAAKTVIRPRPTLDALPHNLRVKILDFGLARHTAKHSNLTDPKQLLGTPGYMSPEQVEGKDVDARTDLFSLGCLLYELTTGAAPFAAVSPMAVLMRVMTTNPTPPSALNPQLAPALAKLIERLMEKAPDNRPSSASEVVAILESIAADTHHAGPTVNVASSEPTQESRHLKITLIMLAAVASVAALAWFAWQLGWF